MQCKSIHIRAKFLIFILVTFSLSSLYLISENVQIKAQLQNGVIFQNSMGDQIEKLVRDRIKQDSIDEENRAVSTLQSIEEPVGNYVLSVESPIEDIERLNDRLDFEYEFYIEQVYGYFLDKISVELTERQSILEEMLRTHQEFRSIPNLSEGSTLVEEFRSTPDAPSYGVLSYLPIHVMERYLNEEQLNQFKAYQFGINGSEPDIINYLESELSAIRRISSIETKSSN